MATWSWKADYFEACNCAHSCPCNLTMLPTDGTCKAVDGWKIQSGSYGKTRLDGLGMALILHWPNPIHKGNGRCVVFIDDRANDAQREALTAIGTGKAGPGGPFEIFASTFGEPPKVRFGKLHFERNGRRARMTLDDIADARLGPILSDMDHSEANAHVVLPDGFIYKDGELVNTDSCEVNAEGIAFRYANTNGILSSVAYNVT